MRKTVVILTILMLIICIGTFHTIMAYETYGPQPVNGKIFKEVTIIIDRDAIIPKTYYYNSADFSGVLDYKMKYVSHHDGKMCYVVYSGWVYSKTYHR